MKKNKIYVIAALIAVSVGGGKNRDFLTVFLIVSVIIFRFGVLKFLL